MFNPMKAQVGDQVLVEIQSLTGKKVVTGQITNWRNHANYIDVMIYVDLDKPVAIWSKNDIRKGFVSRVSPDNETSKGSKFKILA